MSGLRPRGRNSLRQQSKFDEFREEFNNERPHQALDMKCPAEIYTPSPRPYPGLPELAYPPQHHSRSSAADASVCTARKSISARSSPVKLLASKKSKKGFGWLVLWIMIWATSIWRKEPYNLWTTHLVQK